MEILSGYLGLLCMVLLISFSNAQYANSAALVAGIFTAYDKTIPPTVPINITYKLDITNIENVADKSFFFTIMFNEYFQWMDSRLAF